MFSASGVRGEGKVKFIITICGIAACIYLGWKLVPVKLAHSSFYDCLDEQAKLAGVNPRTTAEEIRDNCWKCVKQGNLQEYVPDKSHIKVIKDSAWVSIDVAYQREVDLPVRPYMWNFEVHIKRQLF